VGEREIHHLDRILFGSNHMYVFVNPAHPTTSTTTTGITADSITWEYAQSEIAKAKGYATTTEGLSRDQQRAQEQVLELLPLLSEANALSEELNKQRFFEIVLFSNVSSGKTDDQSHATKVLVKMKNLVNGNEWLWDRAKFMDRRFMMQAWYQDYLENESTSASLTGPPTSKDDPFFDPLENVLVGTVSVFLQSLAYGLDVDDNLLITDYKGDMQGTVSVHISPCDKKGNALDEDFYVEDPAELLGQPYGFKVTIKSAEVTKLRFSKGLNIHYTPFKQTKQLRLK